MPKKTKKLSSKKISKKTTKKKIKPKKAVKKVKNKKIISKKKPISKKTKQKKPIIKKIISKKEEKAKKIKPPIEYLKIPEADIKKFIGELIGVEAIQIIDVLLKKNNVSEFLIAEKLNLPINRFRNIIYKLDNYSLVSFIRKKDKQKGWYIYYWTIDPYKLEDLYKTFKAKKLEKLKDELNKEESGYFYICQNKCERLGLQEAMDLEFRCPECGKLLQQDKSKIIAKLKKDIEVLEEELKKFDNPA